MTERPEEVGRDELHAYADGQLPSSRIAAVEDRLAGEPATAAVVTEWQSQNEGIRALFAAAPDADAAVDRNAVRVLRSRAVRPRARRIPTAAATAVFALGGVFGGISGAVAVRTFWTEPAPAAAPSLPDASRDSYLVYAGELTHPVEVGGDEEAHLVTWLGRRLGATLRAPDLAPLGLRLMGGRLVAYGAAPAALLMYRDPGGLRLTLLIARDPAAGTGFRFAERDDIATVSWTDAGLGYALTAPIGRERLLQIAGAIYGQI